MLNITSITPINSTTINTTPTTTTATTTTITTPTTISAYAPAPLTYPQFLSHLTFIQTTISKITTLDRLYAADPTYFSSSHTYESHGVQNIIQLLSYAFHLSSTPTNLADLTLPETTQDTSTSSPQTPEINVLHYYIFATDFGKNAIPGEYIDYRAPLQDTSHRAPDLSTPEALYDYLTYVYYRDFGITQKSLSDTINPEGESINNGQEEITNPEEGQDQNPVPLEQSNDPEATKDLASQPATEPNGTLG